MLFVYLLRIINAIGNFAIGTVRRGVFGRVFRGKKAQRSERRYLFALFPYQPADNIQIVATLCQNHGTALLAVSPRSAHKGVCLMIIPHVFRSAKRNDISDLSRIDDLLDFFIKRSVPQNMAYNDAPFVFFRCRGYFQTIFIYRGNRLFQKQIISRLHAFLGMLPMLRVLCTDSNDIRRDMIFQKCLVIFINGTIEKRAGKIEPVRIAVNNRCHFKFLRIL